MEKEIIDLNEWEKIPETEFNLLSKTVRVIEYWDGENWHYYKEKQKFPIIIKLIHGDNLEINSDGDIYFCDFEGHAQFVLLSQDFNNVIEAINKAKEISGEKK